MYRIDNSTAISPMPAIGVPGPNPDSFFTGGNPGAGQLATILPAEFMNTIQEELCGVVVGAGLALIKGTNTQLLSAINILKGKFSGATSGVVSVLPQDNAGTYNFNLPTGAGAAGAPLLSGGGGAAPMTYGTVTGTGNFVKSNEPTITGVTTAQWIRNTSVGSDGGVTAVTATGVWRNLFNAVGHGGQGIYLVTAYFGNNVGGACLVNVSQGTPTILWQNYDNIAGTVTFQLAGTMLQVQKGAGADAVFVWTAQLFCKV